MLYSCNSDEMLLFLPGEDGRYLFWRTAAIHFARTGLSLDSRVVAFIERPEQGQYNSTGRCRVIKFVTNSPEKRFRNWLKDCILLVTSMPNAKEVIAMTGVL